MIKAIAVTGLKTIASLNASKPTTTPLKIDNNGYKNIDNKNNTATVTLVKPVLPPCSIPVDDSI